MVIERRDFMSVPLGSKIKQRTDDEWIDAISKAHGNVSQIARLLNTSRQNVQAKMKTNPELKKLLDDERDALIDNCESKLFELVDEKYFPAINLALKTIGATRGWGENITITNKNEDSEDYDLSALTEEEKAELERLTAKIYQPKPSE